MFEIHPSNWGLTIDGGDPQNEFHETVLREAQVATDARGITAAAPRGDSIATRLRLAFAGGPSAAAEPCSCPA
ncbi:MAG TPA: hypothetical protein VM451_01470 [Candidatus Limnocylindria bacterium]|nr:hypothetical protein [Candidatus Limnocylindria bacterium]